MDSLNHLLRADIDQDDRDHPKYSSEEMRHIRCKQHINCDFNCWNNKYLAKNDQKFPKSARSQKKLDIPSPPLFTEIDANDRKKNPRTVRESTQSDNKLFIRQQPDQHDLYIQCRRLATKLLYTSTTTSEIFSLTPSNANGRANSRSIFSEIERANSEKFNNIFIQQHDIQSANSYDPSLNENASEPPKLSFDATALQNYNHCNDIDLGDIDPTIPLTIPMEKRPIRITSIDGFFNRKRGRPPKNRFVEVYKNTNQPPQAIFTSFKLEKNATPNGSIASMNDKQIFEYGGAFHNTVRMVKTPATINPEFAAISQLPIDTTSDSTFKLRSSVAQWHTEGTATMNTAMRFMKGEIESLNKRHDQQSQHRNKEILNTNHLEYREGCIHITPASSQRTQLKDNGFVNVLSIRDKPQDYADTKSKTLKKISVVRTVGTFFPGCNEISGYPSENKPHHENCFDGATTKPGICSTRNVSCKRKRLETANKNMPYESIAKSIGGNEFILPQDLSMRKNSASTVCSHTDTNVLADDSSRPAETAIESKAITPGEAANRNVFGIELGWRDKEAIGLQLNHLLNLYHIPNQQSFKMHTQLKDQHSPVITSTSVTQADNNILPFLSFLLAASNKFQPRPSSPMQIPTTGPAIVTRQHNDRRPTSTMTDGLTAITDLTTAGIAQQKLRHIIGLGKDITQQRKHKNFETATASSTNIVLTTSAKDGSVLFPTSLQTNDNINKPVGYLKFAFNEDCGFVNCGYRQRQSHFHCDRVNCHFSFCDKTLMVQHTERHVHFITLMGEDFQQYPCNKPCGFSNCE